MNLQLFTKQSSAISDLKNPFKKDKITSISLDYDKVLFQPYFSWTAKIRFKNGDTQGSQEFEVTDQESQNAFADLVEKVQNFLKTL